jgi:DedD protein
MPDKDKSDATVTMAAATSTPPVAAPAVVDTPPVSTSVTAAAVAPTAAVQASASLSAKEEIVAPKTDKKPEVKSEVKPESKAVVVPAAKPESKSAPKPVASDEAAKALAILEGKEPPKTVVKSNSTPMVDTAERFVVQVGAFAENDKAREARLKVERAGLKTYVHVAETPQGRRIRVRVGPFATRVEAEKAATKIKTLDLQAAILTL